MKVLFRTEKNWVKAAVQENGNGYKVLGNMVVPGLARDAKKGYVTLNHVLLNHLLPEALVGFLYQHELKNDLKRVYVKLA